MKKRTSVLYISITVLLISLAFSMSYAVLTAKVEGNSAATPMSVNTSSLTIDFTTSEYINNNKMSLINDSEKTDKAEKNIFTISNSSGVMAKYNLALTELVISDNLKSSDFKWELLKNDSIISNGDFSNAISATDYSISSVQSIGNNQTDSYIFRIWLSESGTNQIGLLNGSFNAKVKLVASATTE